MFRIVISVVVILLNSSVNVYSAEESLDDLLMQFDDSSTNSQDDSIESLLEGFDDSVSSNLGNLIEKTKPDKNYYFTSLFSLSSSYSYQQEKKNGADYRGLTRLKFKIKPEIKYKINKQWDSTFGLIGFYDAAYRIKGRSDFTNETLDVNEAELEVWEAYIRGTVSQSIDIKFGRQIVVWGKSDSLRVVDFINPLDFREPGMVDIEDLRLPVTLFKADYYTGDWDISAIVIPEIRFNKLPPFGSDFYLGGQSRLPPEIMPNKFSDAEFAFAAIGNFSGWDLSLHLANFYDDKAHFVDKTRSALKHSRLTMGGITANIVKGSWLAKSEFAYIDGLKFATTKSAFSRADLMLGLDYTGISDMTFSVEAVNRKILSYNAVLMNQPDGVKENESQISLRYTATFFHQKLLSTVLTSFFGKTPADGGFYRASLDYELSDAVSLIVGGIIYKSGDSFLLKSLAKNDRVFADFRYNF